MQRKIRHSRASPGANDRVSANLLVAVDRGWMIDRGDSICLPMPVEISHGAGKSSAHPRGALVFWSLDQGNPQLPLPELPKGAS